MRETVILNHPGTLLERLGRNDKMNVMINPISTTNIIGFFIITFDSILAKDCFIACFTISMIHRFRLSNLISLLHVCVTHLLFFLLLLPVSSFTLHYFNVRNSAIGPSTNIGKNVNAPTITIVPMKMPPNKLLSVRNVPTVSGTNRLFFQRSCHS